MIKNIELFEYSITNPEPVLDSFYFKCDELIIPKSSTQSNKLVCANVELIKNISAFEIAKKNNEKGLQSKIIENINELLDIKNMNSTEFVAFLTTLDMSYSSYEKLKDEEKKSFLKKVLDKYIESRHGVYIKHSYSNSTIQAIKDSKSHKQSGSLANKKISDILERNGFKLLKNSEIFCSQKYIFTDKEGKNIFKNFIKENKIEFLWSKKKENKMPDLMLMKDKKVLIVEHKHKHESGGGQNSQINEIIDFIGQKENISKLDVHYVSFMDGRYFNIFSNEHTDPKVSTQILNIKENLKNNKQNYFVNTAGFIKLIKSL